MRLKEIDQKKKDTATGMLSSQVTAAMPDRTFTESLPHHIN
jgi:hypothetical protein